jgi:peptide/nickel transport system substrate-binding protein
LDFGHLETREESMTTPNQTPQLTWLQQRLTAGKISRREFMGRAAALGVTTALATTLAGQAVKAATPKSGGRMKLAMGHGSTSDTYDPATIENGFEFVMTYAMANTLTEVAPDGGLVPSLAESWEASDDATQWTFKLRKGVEFHDGRTLTAKDVVANINYHRGEQSKSVIKPILDQISELKTDDDHTLVVNLTGGNADFPFNLNTANLAIYPANDAGGIDWQDGKGSGGYVLDSFEPGVRAIFTRNPNYWKEGRAHADEVEMLSITDPTARSNALVTGEVHAIDQVDLKTAALLARQKGVVVEETTGPLHYVYPMQMTKPPFDNLHVRQALKFSIDREELLQKILKGHGTIGNDNPIGPSYRYYAADLEQNAYDPDKARHHLKQAGLSELTVDLSTADAAYAGAVDAAVLYKEHAAKAGININVVREANDGYWSNVWMKKPWCASYWGGYSIEDTMFTTGYAPGAAWNDTQWDNEAFNKLLVDARAELDEGKRREMYREMQRILRDEGGVVAPMFANAVFARSEEIAHGDDVSALRPFDGRRIIERWWLV